MLNQLWERGLRTEAGLQAVIRDGCGELGEAIARVYESTVLEQRCIFHKLRNVADKCREELKHKHVFQFARRVCRSLDSYTQGIFKKPDDN